MNAVSLHDKIDTAKNLLLKENGINGKTHTVASFTESFNVSIPELLALAKDNLIELHNYFLQQGYINEYKRRRAELLAKLHKLQVASLGSGSNYRNTPETEKAFSDQYCGLGKGYYDKLVNGIEIRLDVFSFESLAQQNDAAKKFIRFDIKFSPEKIQEFLDEKIDSFMRDELNLSEIKDDYWGNQLRPTYHKTHRALGYQKQKEDFSIAIQKELGKGYPVNSLKIDYTQIWDKNTILHTSFIETAMGLEREGLIEIKDIFQQESPHSKMIATSDDFWKYPTIIQMRVLPEFHRYYKTLYDYKSQKADAIKKMVQNKQQQATSQNESNKEMVGLVLGPLSYKNNSIYYNDNILDLTPQAVKLCKLFMKNPDVYVSDNAIQETISTGGFVSHQNMQKVISKLRTALRKAKCNIEIKRLDNSGYKFITQKIR